MNNRVEQRGEVGRVGPDGGLEGLRQNPGFRGPVGPAEGHAHSTDHVALLYEDREDQFAAVVPFIREGLDRGERCMYVADENSRESVLEAMRTRGIDVDDALDSGTLSVHTPAETYHRTGEFDRDAMLAYWEETLEEATGEGDFTGVRAAAEMTWALDDGVDFDLLVEYEAVLNSLYEGEDYTVMCQYNRERFPAAVVRDVVKTHPYLVAGDTVSQNFYYTPPEKFFGPERPADEVDRMTETLREWTKAKAELEERQRFLRESYDITSDPELSFDEKLDRLLDLGCERFDLEMAGLNHLPSWDGAFRLEKGVGLGIDQEDEPLWTDPGEGCFCREAVTSDAPVSVADVRETDWADDPIHEEFGLTSYLGTKVSSGSSPYGTLWFGSREPREPPFSETERTFVELIGQWVSYEIEKREHRRFQRELYELAADSGRAFEEKLEAVFELGCDRFDLEHGGMARIDPDTDTLEIEAVSGDHDHLEPNMQVALSETYCRVLGEGGETAGVTDPVADGFAETLAYEQFGVNSYLGTRIELEDGLDRTLFFVSNEPREEFSEADRTFHHLMGQWVQYELERRQNEQALEAMVDQLQQSNDRLKQFAYAASHDLQEPLRMVSSYLQLLENRYGDELDADAREYIDFAVDGADRMRSMVDDLLAYSRVEQSDGEFERVDCDALLADVVDDLQVTIEESDATIDAESLPTVTGDRKQLAQLFSNLVSNAVKYNDAETPRVEITATRRGDRWEFSVADNGIGIDPDRRDRIFEVFKRLHHGDEYPGTGIGLSLCQEIVENHGGDIWVESEPGDGSTFFFTLPRRTAN